MTDEVVTINEKKDKIINYFCLSHFMLLKKIIPLNSSENTIVCSLAQMRVCAVIGHRNKNQHCQRCPSGLLGSISSQENS